jgi:aminoglycoside 6'-N-acetyltransferase
VITFRHLLREDFACLAEWLRRPHVAEWWRESHEPAAIEERYGPVIDGADETEIFIAKLDGTPIGMVQWYQVVDHPEWRRTLAVAHPSDAAAGMDYLIGDERLLGHGLGPRMLAAFLAEILPRYPQIDSIAISVSQGNRRSWRTLEKLGFRRVWAGELASTHPSDEGLSYVYVREAR